MSASRDQAAKPASSRVVIGQKVRITGGLACGVEATVAELWPTKAGGVRQWVVVSGDLVRRRVIREDYLEPVTP